MRPFLRFDTAPYASHIEAATWRASRLPAEDRPRSVADLYSTSASRQLNCRTIESASASVIEAGAGRNGEADCSEHLVHLTQSSRLDASETRLIPLPPLLPLSDGRSWSGPVRSVRGAR